MRSILSTFSAFALGFFGLATLISADGAAIYRDPVTGFTFSEYDVSYQIGKTIAFRIAIPSGVPSGTAFDAVLQIVAPVDVGWVGLAWGGKMTLDPLAVAWQNGQTAVVSSRYATAHSMPTAYTGSSYTILKTGTKVNSTHYTLTTKVSGATQWTASGTTTTLNPSGSNRLAFAYASAKPSNPSSNTSTISVHDVYNYWTHDFSTGQNSNFAALVTKNTGGNSTRGF